MPEISRRGFLQALLGGAAGAAIAPYIPKSYFFVGKAAGVRGATLAEIDALTLKHFAPGILDNLFKSAPLLEYLRQDDYVVAWKPRALGPSIVIPTAEELTFHGAPLLLERG